MRLQLQAGKFITDEYGAEHHNAVCTALSVNIDDKKQVVVKVGVHHSINHIDTKLYKPLKIITWVFSEDRQEPQSNDLYIADVLQLDINGNPKKEMYSYDGSGNILTYSDTIYDPNADLTIEANRPKVDYLKTTYTGHIGSVGIMSTMDILKPTNDPQIITPKIRASQDWIMLQRYDDTRKFLDLWEFDTGLFTGDTMYTQP